MIISDLGSKGYAAVALLLAAATILAPSYWASLNTPAAGIYHDDAIYILTARTLAEGRGYSIDSLPTPIAQTKYPILFPALLAVVWKLMPAFPANVFFFKLVPLLAAFSWLALSYILLRQQTQSPVFAASAIALIASSPQVVFLSTTVLSETVFAALATASLLFWLRHAQSDRNLDLILAAAFAAAAFHTRTIGFCLVLAGLLALVWQRKWRQCLFFALVAGTLALPWLVWQAIHRHGPDAYLSQENYYQSFNIVFKFNWNEKLRIAMTNLVSLPLSVTSLFDLPWGGILGFATIPWILRALVRKDLPLAIQFYLLLSYTIIVFWVWPPLRFLVPLLPLLLWGIWSGAPTIVRKVLILWLWLLFA